MKEIPQRSLKVFLCYYNVITITLTYNIITVARWENPIELYDSTSIKNKFTADYFMNFHLAYLVFVITFCSSFYLILMKLFVSDASWKRPAEAYLQPFFAKIIKNMSFFNVPKFHFLISFVFFLPAFIRGNYDDSVDDKFHSEILYVLIRFKFNLVRLFKEMLKSRMKNDRKRHSELQSQRVMITYPHFKKLFDFLKNVTLVSMDI